MFKVQSSQTKAQKKERLGMKRKFCACGFHQSSPKPHEHSVKPKTRDKKLMDILSELELGEIMSADAYDLIMRRVRAKGPRNEIGLCGGRSWNECNDEWRRRLK